MRSLVSRSLIPLACLLAFSTLHTLLQFFHMISSHTLLIRLGHPKSRLYKPEADIESHQNSFCPPKIYVHQNNANKNSSKETLAVNKCICQVLNFKEAHRQTDKSHHCILIIDFNNNDGGVISELAGFTKQLHVLKDKQLIPCWAQCLRQNLNTEPTKIH